MSLLQLLGSVIAVFIVAAIARWLFPVRFRLDDAHLRHELDRVYPDLTAEEILIDQAGDAALLRLSGGMGLVAVRRLGDKAVLRHWAPGTKVTAAPAPTGLVLDTDDFTEPKITLALDAEGVARAESWLALLDAPNGHAHAA
ncbi:hypothetical protein [Gimibacter soli]|uniref:Uncharacterized protein n=1 Tax=Gimibacter soli TaxID=3024400 RepID=A0AAE9XM11_9PROT|nr:hypothetical protein [Gimibacter soli]WCL52751.1 hypothetical protein PH603_09390 [Gimibacter soli]